MSHSLSSRLLPRRAVRRLTAAVSTAALSMTGVALLPGAPAQALSLPSQCVTSGITVTCTFTARGVATSFNVPAGVTSMHVRVVGERGGASTLNGSVAALGGSPAFVDGTVPVSEGELITARLLDDGGAAGLSSAGRVAGRGGGSVFVAKQTIIVAHAAGGGGAGATETVPGDSSNGGAAGQFGISGDYSFATGGSPAAGGQPGSQTAGGNGGAGGWVDSCGPGIPSIYPNGQSGAVHKGGNGGSAEFGGVGGGGGGGGRYGGGGGGAGGEGCFTFAYAGGGGGGSSTLIPGGTTGLVGSLDPTYRAVLTFTLARRSNHTPANMNFGNVPVGTQSAFQTFTLNNTGSAALSVGTGAIGGANAAQFVKGVDNCSGKTIPDGTSCTVQLAFKPTVGGASSATFSISDGSPQSPHTVTLNGTGAQPAPLTSVSTISFGSQEVGKPGPTKTLQVLNNGNAPMLVTGTTFTGANPGDFTKVSDSCTGASIAPNSVCVFTLRMTATAVGARNATFNFAHNGATGTSAVTLTGIGTPPADLKIRGIGSVYTGRDHLVTRTVTASGALMTYPVVILNEDTVARSYKINLVKTGPGAAAEVWSSGFGAKALPTDGSGNFVTGSVLPGKTVTYNLRVTPTAPGQTINSVLVSLLADTGGTIESLSTQTNTAAPANGTSAYELFVKQGAQPYIGGPVSGQTATGPSLNVGNSAPFAVRLKNNGASPAQIGLRLTDVDGCGGAFSVTATAGGVSKTTAVFNGTYLTPVRNPGQYTDVTVTIKRVAGGCPSKTIKAESLQGGVVVRTSYLLANSAYNATTD